MDLFPNYTNNVLLLMICFITLLK